MSGRPKQVSERQTKRIATLEAKVERLRDQKKEAEKVVDELRWHVTWALDFLGRKNLLQEDRIRIALDWLNQATERIPFDSEGDNQTPGGTDA